MRVLHIISNMRPESGGPQEAVRMLMRHAPSGCVSEAVTLDQPTAAYLAAETLTVHALGTKVRLLEWLRANLGGFDGVVLHGMWEWLSYAVLRAVAGRKPYIVYPHGMLDPYFKRAHPLKHLRKWLYWLAVQFWVLRRARRVVFTTEAERELAAQSFWLHRWNAAVIGLGSEAPPLDLAGCSEAFFALCPAVRGRRYLLFLGRLDRKKGCDLLIEAFAATDDAALHLVMAGPDSSDWRSELEQFAERLSIAGRVRWPGMLTGAAKWGAFAGCDAFALPSHQENFGIAVVEALACGKPALLSRAINIAADCEADGCALVEDDTLEATQRLLARWLALSAEQRRAMGERARHSANTRYDMRRNAEQLVRCFDTAAETTAVAVAEARGV